MPVGKISARLGVLDNPTSRPFINAFKQAWSWQGDRGGAQWDALVSGGYMTSGGQLISVAPNSGGFRTRMLFNMPAQAGGTGRWRMRWEGIATVDLYGVQNVTRPTANEINFDFVANGSSWVDVVVRTINPAGGQIRSFSVVHQDDIADFDAGEIYRKQYLEEIKNYDTLRFDEWIGILRSEGEGGLRITSWESRALPTDEIFHRFVPYEYMVELCKETNSNMWVCLPTAATNDHMVEAAKLIKNLLPEPLKVYAEYSTKTWDFSGTPQAHYCAEKGREAFGTSSGSEFRNWYGMRSTQMAQFWRQIWGTDDRLQTVVQHQADWQGGEVDVLEAPLWRQRSNTRGLPVYVEPSSVIDVFTVHAQIDGGMAYGGRTNQIETWRTTLSRENAFNNLRDQLLRGTYWAADRTITTLTPKWEHYVEVANSKGMTLAVYEVGNHLNGIGGTAATRQFVQDFSVSSQMGEVYTTTFNRLREVGFSGPLCMSVECRLPDQNISHGLQRWLGDHNPAWTAVNALMEDKPDVVVPTPVDPTPVDPDPVEEPEVPTPVEPTPVEEPEEPNMPDRQKLNEVAEALEATLADLKEYLGTPTTEPEQPPVEEPETPPVVTPVPVPDKAIWQILSGSTVSIPSVVEVPAGQRDIYIPVTVDKTDRQSFYATVDRLINVNGGGINVGTSAQQRNFAVGMDKIYTWSPGDDLTHYIKLTTSSTRSAGQSFKAFVKTRGLGDSQKGKEVIIRFVEGAQHPEMPEQFHRPMRTLKLTGQPKNSFNPSTVKWSDSGYDKDGKPVWRSRLAHGYSQPGNGETGLYQNDHIKSDGQPLFPRADKPISYDSTEDAIRLHTFAYPDGNPVIFEGSAFKNQAAVIQGQNLTDVCGEDGVWRAVIKSTNRQYAWPAFWLTGVGYASNGTTWAKWPPEIDIFEHFNGSWGASDTNYTTTFGQHYGNQNSGNRLGAFGNEVEVNRWFPDTTPLHTDYHSYACSVVYDPNDTTKSEVTFFFDDKEIGCQVLYARHEDLTKRVPFMPIVNVAVRQIAGTADSYNNDISGDILVRDVSYYPTGFTLE